MDFDVLLHSSGGAISRAMSVGVLVVGCGHSGTSTVAKWFVKHNFWLNPLRSYKRLAEDKNLIRFNDEFRNQFNSTTSAGSNKLTSWGKWIDLMIESAKDINTFVADPAMVDTGAATINQNVTVKRWLNSYPLPFVLKDPNFVHTLSFWTSLFEQLGEGLPSCSFMSHVSAVRYLSRMPSAMRKSAVHR
jgi:hypothetical protein